MIKKDELINMKKLKIYIPILMLISSPVLSQDMINKPLTESDKIYNQAQSEYKKHNYLEAVNLYKKALIKNPENELRKGIILKLIENLTLSKKWNDSISQLDKYIKEFKDDYYYQAKINNLGAILYELVPHQGFKRNGKIYRDQEIKEGEYIYAYAEDQKRTNDYFQKSKDYYYKLKESKIINQEIIDLNLDYGQFLESSGSDIPRTIDIKASINRNNLAKMENSQKIVFLYDEIFELNKVLKNNHNEALSLFRKAGYFVRKNGITFDYETIQDKKMLSENPIPLLEKLIRNYPKDELVPEAIYSVGHIYSSKQELTRAVKYFEKVIQNYPKSIRLSDSKAQIQEIKSQSLIINNTGVQASKNKPKITISSKNIESIEVKLYKTDLVKVLKKENTRPEIYFNNFNQNFGEKISNIKKYAGQKVLSLKVDTGDKRDYKNISKEINLPDIKTGAYLVEVTDNNGHSSISLLMISDITIVKNIDNNKAVIYILDKETGKPLKNANILVREHFYDISKGKYQINNSDGKTNNQGEFIHKKQNIENSYSYIDVLAYDKDQIIFSNAHYYYNYYNQNQSYQAYVYTDRPVYRPEQKVSFKELITFNKDGNNQNLKEKKVHITISDAKGDEIYEKDLVTNNYGSITDSFTLKKGAALGMYYINSSVENNQFSVNQSSGQSFRVEEYKKPEFIVNVKADESKYNTGDKIKVQVNSDYYFGSPVANAKVTYKVLKSNFYYYFYPYNNFYYRESNYMPSSNGGSIYKQGEITTDDKGKAFIEFDSEKSDTDFKYDILVDVVDKSRREIKGAISVKVTSKPYYAFINLKQGFYSAGENADIQINLKNANDEAVQDKGILKIYSLKYPNKTSQKEELKEVFSKNVESDKNGEISYRWKTQKGGNYRIIFESLDKKVTTEHTVWVTGENFNGRDYKFANIEVLTDKAEYQEGETARIMVSTNYFDSDIILYIENDKTILSHKLINIKNKSKVIEVKIGKELVPNFNIKALLIKDSQMYLENKEVDVPPTRQFLNVSIYSDKDSYLPAEKTFLKVKTSDYQNKGVPAEISLSVADKSVYYIQSDLTGDIKQFYYGQKRYFQNNLSSSLNLYLYPVTENDDKKVNYIRHSDPFYNYNRNTTFAHKSVSRSNAIPSPVSYSTSIEAGLVNPSAPASRNRMEAKKESFKDDSLQKPGQVLKENVLQESEIRSYFPDTALWKPIVQTDKNGNAKIELNFPDSLTTWKVDSKVIDLKSRVGSASTELVTKKNIIARLQAPRFFIENDEVVISAIVNNDLDTEKEVKCVIETTDQLQNLDKNTISVNIGSKGEKRVDWRFKVKKAGTTQITLKALTDVESDASLTKFPVNIHGIDKYIANSGVIEKDSMKEFSLNIPAKRKIGDTKVNITVNSSIISTLVDSLPYLASYPYGCIEQTTSRFIPALLVNKIVKKAGIDFSKMTPDANDKEKTKFLDKINNNPIYNNVVLNNMVTDGLKRIYSFQNYDGGFGWWNGFNSDTYMTSYVTYSLILAKQSDNKIDESVLERALEFLTKKFNSDEEIYDRLYIAYVLSMEKRVKLNQLETFFKGRDSLNNYGKALLSLAYFNLGDKNKADLICQNLKSFALVDNDNQTVSWKNDTRYYWYWYGDRIETNTFIFKAFMRSKPNDKFVPMLSKWLIQNRQGNHWYSTKDTANTIYALTEFAEINKEINPDYTVSIFNGNKLLKKVKVNKSNMFDFDNSIDLTDKDLDNAKNKIRIVKEGKGNLYYSASSKFFSLEENIKASSSMISVKRDYFKLVENGLDKNKKSIYNKVLLKEGDTLKSGDLIEVKLSVKSNNDYEYLIFEDMKPAGFEATELQSGYLYQNGLSLSREIRDDKNAFFVNNLSQGTQIINYQLRAEIPGIFHSLPTKAYAMYADQIRANSDESIFKIKD